MKITIIQGAFLPVPPLLGGAVEKRWFALAKQFAKEGHEVTQISRLYGDLPKEEMIDGVRHKRIGGYATPLSIIKLKLFDLFYSIKALPAVPKDSDIIVTNTFWAPIILPARLKKRCMVDVARMPKGQIKFYKNTRLRANSTPVASAIKAELHDGEMNRVVTIPNPLPFQNPPAVPTERKQPVILYTGRVHPEKGIDLLIEAFRKLNLKWTLKIVGPYDVAAGGGGNSYLEVLKQKAGNASIEFKGPIYDMELLNRLYEEASIFAYPSLAEKGETFGLAPLEAMAWGAVPIVSDLDCFKDFISNGANGMIFNHRSKYPVDELTQAMKTLITDVEQRHCLSQQAVKVQQSHSVAVIARQFLNDFDHIRNKNTVD